MSEVDEYLAGTPEPQRHTLAQLRETIESILPVADEGMSYGIPAFKIEGVPVAGFADAKKHCSYFPHSGDVLEQVGDELLAGYDWSKGTLRFAVDTVPDEQLIRRLIELRLTEINLR